MTVLVNVPTSRDQITLAWLQRIFQPRGIKVHRFNFAGEDIGKGRGMMSSLEQIDLEISREEREVVLDENNNEVEVVDNHEVELEHLSIVLKTLPGRDQFQWEFAVHDGFSSREVSMYTDVLQQFKNFLSERGVSLDKSFRFPECYYGAEVGEGESYKYILVLENLKSRNYQPWGDSITQTLSWTACSAIVTQMARLHATGIAFKKSQKLQEKETRFDWRKRFPKLNHHVSPITHIVWDHGFQVTKEVIRETLDEKTEIPQGLFEQLDKLQSEECKNFAIKLFTEPETLLTEKCDREKLTVCHNDLHSYNVVLDDKQNEAVIFDYQSSCVFNPMKDLTFFIILCCEDCEPESDNIQRLFQLYHDEFQRTMRMIKCDFEYSLDSIREDYDRFFALSLSHVITGAPVWITGDGATVFSKRRFAMLIVNAFNRGILRFPVDNCNYDVNNNNL